MVGTTNRSMRRCPARGYAGRCKSPGTAVHIACPCTSRRWTERPQRNSWVVALRSRLTSRYFFPVSQIFQPKALGHLSDFVPAIVFARFELLARSALNDGPVGGVAGIRRKFPAGRLMCDAVVVNFKL